jgi:hypothetical protein
MAPNGALANNTLLNRAVANGAATHGAAANLGEPDAGPFHQLLGSNGDSE